MGQLPSRVRDTTLLRLARAPDVGLWLLRFPSLLARLPEGEQARLKSRYYQAVARARLHELELQHVLNLLQQQAIPTVLLKGAAHLVTRLYPDAALRPMGDLDIWLPQEHMSHALEILTAHGYTIVHKERRPTRLRMHYAQEIELLGRAERGVALDLHYRPFIGWWALLAAQIPLTDLWTRRHFVVWRGIPIALLAPEDHLIHLAFHFGVNHHFSYPGLRYLVDMALTIRARPVDWAHLGERAKAWGVRTVVWAALTLLNTLVPEHVPDALLHELAPPTVQQHLLRRALPTARELLNARSNQGRARYVLLLLLCDTPRYAWPRLFTWALWPEKQWLRLRYGENMHFLRLRHLWNVLAHPLF